MHLHPRPRGPCPPALAATVVAVVAVLSALASIGPFGAGVHSFGPPAGAGVAVLAGFVDAGYATPAPAVSHPPPPQPTWIDVTGALSGPSPPSSFGGVSAYDAADNETVYFGGALCLGCSVVSNATWVFSSGVWRNITDWNDSPPAVSYPSMDYDANAGGVVLFGGNDAAGLPLNETWLFQGGAWTNVSYFGPAPPPRWGAGMAFDPQPEENGSVLFGGYGNAGYYNDTWVWQANGGWVALNGNSIEPPQVADTALAYDAADGYIVQFGGYGPGVGYDGETWELYSGQWWAVQPSPAPDARDLDDMVYDPGLPGVVLEGGWSGSAELNNTWVFSAGAWTKEAPGLQPEARDSVGLALDGTGTTPVLVGGDNLTQTFNDTWVYEFAPTVGVSSNLSGAEVGENVTFFASVSGGTAPYTVEFTFGDGSDAFVTGPGPTLSVAHQFAAVGTFTVTFSLADAVGATAVPVSGEAFPVTAGPSVSATASPSVVDIGIPIDFNATAAGGTGPFVYSWSFGDGTTATAADASHAFSASGTYTATVAAVDHDQSRATYTVGVTVHADPSVVIGDNISHPAAGAMTTFFANVSGGTGPYRYVWEFGGGGTSSVPDPQHAFSSAGTYSVEVWANDSVGGSVHQTLSVTVGSGPGSTSGSLGGAPLWFWGGVAALAAVAVVGGTLLLRRGRAPPR
jgi:hypothetical protein